DNAFKSSPGRTAKLTPPCRGVLAGGGNVAANWSNLLNRYNRLTGRYEAISLSAISLVATLATIRLVRGPVGTTSISYRYSALTPSMLPNRLAEVSASRQWVTIRPSGFISNGTPWLRSTSCVQTEVS